MRLSSANLASYQRAGLLHEAHPQDGLMTWVARRKYNLRSQGVSGWQEQRDAQRILIRDGRRCYLCGGHATEVDHVIPLAEGGADTDTNKRAICGPHHRDKTRAERTRGIARRPSLHRPAEPHPGLVGGGPPPRGGPGSTGAAAQGAYESGGRG